MGFITTGRCDIRIFFNIIGLISTILGFIGVFIPILPTVPFLILATICFSRGSEKFNRKLQNSKVYKYYMNSYAKMEMTLKEKIIAQIKITILLLIGAFFTYKKVWVLCILIFVWSFHFYYFFYRVRLKKEE